MRSVSRPSEYVVDRGDLALVALEQFIARAGGEIHTCSGDSAERSSGVSGDVRGTALRQARLPPRCPPCRCCSPHDLANLSWRQVAELASSVKAGRKVDHFCRLKAPPPAGGW